MSQLDISQLPDSDDDQLMLREQRAQKALAWMCQMGSWRPQANIAGDHGRLVTELPKL